MDRLVAFGCSLTQGQYLPDNYNTDKPSKLSWPQLLANKLNLQCINLGKGGASSKEILYKILNFDFNKNDFAVILWSHNDRDCIISSENLIEQIGIWKVDYDKLSKFYFETFYKEINTKIQNHIYYNYCNLYLKNKKIRQLHLQANRENININSYSESFNKWNNVKILNVFISDIRKNFPLALDNHHPGIEAHENFANQIFEKYIKSDYV